MLSVVCIGLIDFHCHIYSIDYFLERLFDYFTRQHRNTYTKINNNIIITNDNDNDNDNRVIM